MDARCRVRDRGAAAAAGRGRRARWGLRLRRAKGAACGRRRSWRSLSEGDVDTGRSDRMGSSLRDRAEPPSILDGEG